METFSSYLYKLLQGLSVQACVILQELELFQLELVPKMCFCLLLQQLEHHSTQEEVKEVPQYQKWSPADLPAVHSEEGHAADLPLPAPAEYFIRYCSKMWPTQNTQESHTHVPSYCHGEFFNKTSGYQGLHNETNREILSLHICSLSKIKGEHL